MLVLAVVALMAPPDTLAVRAREETAAKSGRYHAVAKQLAWSPAKSAVVVCDMWDKHWCPGATARVGELAPRVNEVLVALRKKGVLVVHCPSDTMDFYANTPARKLAQDAPKSTPKVPLERWCKLDPKREGKLPIDDSDGGCEENVKNYKAWSRQHPAIEILPGDAVTDSDEAYHLFRQRGIETVFVLGVHTNMCVLGRPFSIRQLVQQGLNVVLVRDLTDTMYNPAKAPFVSHFTGTDLVVEHIEKFWCPTTTSADLIGGKAFRFAADTRPHVAIVTAEDEYKTEDTLPAFALAQLGKQFRVSIVYGSATDKHHLPGLDVLDSADVLLLSVRRRPLLEADLARVRKFIAAGKPVVAIRTSSHAFAPKKGEALPAGVAEWPTFDRDILGCHYDGHHANALKTKLTFTQGVDAVGYESAASLYRSAPLAADCIVWATGSNGKDAAEPVAWVRPRAMNRGPVFYTSLGHADDFKEPAFLALLTAGVRWASGK